MKIVIEDRDFIRNLENVMSDSDIPKFFKEATGREHTERETCVNDIRRLLMTFWNKKIQEMADARLITSVPELLAACKEALAHLDEDSSEFSRWVGVKLRIAIEKTEGDKEIITTNIKSTKLPNTY